MGRAAKHIHRYQRTRPRTEFIWKCMLPGCTHFIPLNISVIGRFSSCWECGEAFVMDDAHLAVERPLCGHNGKYCENKGNELIETKSVDVPIPINKLDEITERLMQEKRMERFKTPTKSDEPDDDTTFSLNDLLDTPDEIEVIEPTNEDTDD